MFSLLSQEEEESQLSALLQKSKGSVRFSNLIEIPSSREAELHHRKRSRTSVIFLVGVALAWQGCVILLDQKILRNDSIFAIRTGIWSFIMFWFLRLIKADQTDTVSMASRAFVFVLSFFNLSIMFEYANYLSALPITDLKYNLDCLLWLRYCGFYMLYFFMITPHMINLYWVIPFTMPALYSSVRQQNVYMVLISSVFFPLIATVGSFVYLAIHLYSLSVANSIDAEKARDKVEVKRTRNLIALMSGEEKISNWKNNNDNDNSDRGEDGSSPPVAQSLDSHSGRRSRSDSSVTLSRFKASKSSFSRVNSMNRHFEMEREYVSRNTQRDDNASIAAAWRSSLSTDSEDNNPEDQSQFSLEITSWWWPSHIRDSSEMVDDLITMFDRLGSFARFGIRESDMRRYICVVRNEYLPNPYHCFQHAYSTAHSVFLILTEGRQNELFSDVDILAIMISAIGHDAGHIGRNTNYLVAINHWIVRKYGTESPLEKYHHNVVTSIIRNISMNGRFLSKLTDDEFEQLLEAVRENVLKTDLAGYGRLLRSMKDLWSVYDRRNPKHRRVLSSFVLACSDISNVTFPFPISKTWSGLLVQEFMGQGDEEIKNRMPVSDFMDRSNPKPATMIVGFIEHIAFDFFDLLTVIFPRLSPIMDRMKFNLQEYRILKKREMQGHVIQVPLVSQVDERSYAHQ